jgi:hypothetical protein
LRLAAFLLVSFLMVFGYYWTIGHFGSYQTWLWVHDTVTPPGMFVAIPAAITVIVAAVLRPWRIEGDWANLATLAGPILIPPLAFVSEIAFVCGLVERCVGL